MRKWSATVFGEYARSRHAQYFGEDGEAIGEVGEYFGDDGDMCAGARAFVYFSKRN